jgi:hypothetical protein
MWESDMSTTRKEILQRKQKGKAILPNWKAAIEDACKQRIEMDDFLDLEETERLRTAFFYKVRDGDYEHRFVAKPAFGELAAALRTMAADNKRKIVLFHSMDKFIGALKISKRAALEHLEAVWSVVEEDFCVAASDLTSGLCLEENHYDQSGNFVSDGIFELTAWGEFAIM